MIVLKHASTIVAKCFLMLLLNSSDTAAQESENTDSVFRLINEARSNPQGFLEKHRDEIQLYEPKFIPLLEKSRAINPVVWDAFLATNCKERVQGNLNPVYKGPHELCGSSYGNGEGVFEQNAIYFLFDMFTHIMDEQYSYFGFFKNPDGYAYRWGKSCEKRTYHFQFHDSLQTPEVNMKLIHTAADKNEISLMDKEMIKEINFVRHYPLIYASIVGRYLSEESKLNNGLTKDKLDAGTELMNELRKMKQLQVLTPKHCVLMAAQKHGEDCRKRGFIDHTGSDGSDPLSRISDFCVELSGNENIACGRKNARMILIELLIDAGISSRGHRHNILDPEWQYVGCYGYDHGTTYCCVQKFAK